MYYSCSENKGADQLCSYCTADLRLCFRIGKNLIFSYVFYCETKLFMMCKDVKVFREYAKGRL